MISLVHHVFRMQQPILQFQVVALHAVSCSPGEHQRSHPRACCGTGSQLLLLAQLKCCSLNPDKCSLPSAEELGSSEESLSSFLMHLGMHRCMKHRCSPQIHNRGKMKSFREVLQFAPSYELASDAQTVPEVAQTNYRRFHFSLDNLCPAREIPDVSLREVTTKT